MEQAFRSRSRSKGRDFRPASVQKAIPARSHSGRVAFVTLASGEGYCKGAALLASQLRRKLGSEVEVVVFGEACALGGVVDESALQGCTVRALDTLEVPPAVQRLPEPSLPYFSFCWRKLGLWALEEFDTIVYIDADILVVGSDLTNLYEEPPNEGAVAAAPACQCWIGPEQECHYTAPEVAIPSTFYFNAGVLVLRPSRKDLAEMCANLELAANSGREFPFAEQDFLNEYFAGRCAPLPCRFNALKPAFHNERHRGKLVPIDSRVALLHYVMTKPWDHRAPKLEPEFMWLHQLWLDAWASEFAGPQIGIKAWKVHPLLDIYYVPDFITADYETQLLSILHDKAHEEDEKQINKDHPAQPGQWVQLRRRRLQCWGGVPHPDGSLCEPLPAHIQQVAASVVAKAHSVGWEQPFDQCLVNAYPCGSGIDAHCDGPVFFDAVAILSLESPAAIYFGLVEKKLRPDLPPRLELLLRPRSLLLFRGEAYGLYVHGVPHVSGDTIGPLCANRTAAGASLEEIVPRTERRTSLTLRRLRHVQSRAKARGSWPTEHLQAAAEAQWSWWGEQLSEID